MTKTTDELDMSQALLNKDLEWIKSKLTEIEVKVSNHFVTKEEFEPYKKIIQLVGSLIIVSVVGGMLALIFVNK